MSFLRTTTTATTLFSARTASAARAASVSYSFRALSASAVRHKTVTDSVKEKADSINKKVGQTLASGIEKGQETTSSADMKPTADSPGKAKAEAVRQDTNHAMGKAAGKLRDVKDDLKKDL